MKQRTGFVANSSSSSFIIAIKDLNYDCGEVSPFIKKMIDKLIKMLTNSGESIASVSDVEAYIVDQYGCRNDTLESVIEDEWIKDLYCKMINGINNGYSIRYCEIDNDEQSKMEVMCELPKEDDGSGIYLIYGD